MNIHDLVKLIPWSEEWAEIFLQEKERIVSALTVNGQEAEIFHVGSTSVRDMISKPIIDILICLKSEPEECIAALEGIGYRNLGECDRKGRYFLSYGNEENHTFYAHLCRRDHPVAEDQLLFQKLERTDPTVFDNYRILKAELACMYPDNRYMYRYIKGLYIEGVLSAYRKALPEDDGINYWIIELEMPQEAAEKLQRILDENEMTLDEFAEAGLQYVLDHPEEVKRWAKDNTTDNSIRILREYPVYKGETRARARKRKLAEETAE